MKILKELKNIIFNDDALRKIIIHKKMTIDGSEFAPEIFMEKFPSFNNLTIEDDLKDDKVYSKIIRSYLEKEKIAAIGKVERDIRETSNKVFLYMYLFYRQNQRILKLKNSAIELQLEHTELKDICFSDVKIPFPIFYVSLEKKFEKFISFGYKKEVYIDGVFVLNTEDYLHLDILFKVKTISDDEEFSGRGFVHNLFFRIKKNEKINSSIKSTRDDSINEIIKKALFEEFVGSGLDSRMPAADNFLDELSEYALFQTLKIIMFYNIAINNKNDIEIETENKVIQLNTKNSNKSTLKKYGDCNYTYILSNKSKSSKEITEQIIKRGKIEKKFMVTGHYRNQPYGSGENIHTELIWIEPYLKGIEYNNDDKLNITII